MEYKGDTIAAISTPVGIGGIAVIRISGENSIEIITEIFKGNKPLKKAKSHSVHFGKIIENNKIIDEVLVTVFKTPNSYTGEDVVEISCHGSTFIANQILQIILQKARLAEPGEFTQRAFFNNRLDLTQAEAVGDLINAKTKKSLNAAIQQLEGSLYEHIENLLEKLTDYRTLLEVEIDFLEQDVPDIDVSKLENNLSSLKQELEKLAETGTEGLILRDGFKISLVGAPNVGKSSIFNAFLETERAIVTPSPGTTRDYLEEAISLNGYLIRIFDTAGIHDTSDSVEKVGIKRSYEIIKNSHKILFIIDGNENNEEFEILKNIVGPDKIIKVLNKADIFSDKELKKFRKDYIFCSAIQENGLKKIKEYLIKDIEISEEELHSGILSNTRQVAAVKRAIKSIQSAINSLENKLGFEFTAFDLKEASSALEEIIGKITTDDILNQVFENFCIGK
ncbi:MAG: tRNA uridine-5-carboxymethylaminomethyl(34) synthesis GTPase MnmE [Armatimonadetes bacterium]|nr:tRNA uridine-5-carboxymethylaminomethyl(34) synthesis GTPase MnmE [Armatimonadota bacterium]